MIRDKIIVKNTDFFQPGIIKILIKSCSTCNVKLSRILVESCLKSCHDPGHFPVTRFCQDLWTSWTNSCCTYSRKLFKILIITCLKSCHDPGHFPVTRFSQDFVVSSGKKGDSWQDPSRIYRRSGPEKRKILTRVLTAFDSH